MNQNTGWHSRRHSPLTLGCLLARAGVLGLGALAAPSADAFEFDTGNPDLRVLWDTTLKYSAGFRTSGSSNSIIGGPNYDSSSVNYFPNTDDGSRNFKRGLVSDRLDAFTEFDVNYRGIGARVSGAGWYDSVYRRDGNANNSPSTANPVSVPNNRFTTDTARLHGAYAEVLDAFVFGKTTLGGMPATLRVGKHTVLYGESFMLGGNGIAAAQAPIDVIKAASVPNAQFKEFMLPVNQVSGQLQITPDVMVGAYYLLEWRSDRMPASGSYYSFMDALGTGGERLIVGSSPAGNVGFLRQGDMAAKRNGQGGIQLRFHAGEVDCGLYAVRWNDHGASGLYLHPYATPVADARGLQVGTYQWVYPEGIRAYGASFSTTLDNVNLAGEVSLRDNTPLDSDAQTDTVGANNSNNPLYAVGKSAHAQTSWIASLGPSFISREADFVGEIGFNRRLSISRNAAALNPNATRDSANVRMVYEPKYRQVSPGIDISVPVGVGYGLYGNSSVTGSFLGQGVGDVSLGLNGSYLDAWRFGLNWTHYFGPSAPFIQYGHRTFAQQYADRDYLSFNVRRTF